MHVFMHKGLLRSLFSLAQAHALATAFESLQAKSLQVAELLRKSISDQQQLVALQVDSIHHYEHRDINVFFLPRRITLYRGRTN